MKPNNLWRHRYCCSESLHIAKVKNITWNTKKPNEELKKLTVMNYFDASKRSKRVHWVYDYINVPHINKNSSRGESLLLAHVGANDELNNFSNDFRKRLNQENNKEENIKITLNQKIEVVGDELNVLKVLCKDALDDELNNDSFWTF